MKRTANPAHARHGGLNAAQPGCTLLRGCCANDNGQMAQHIASETEKFRLVAKEPRSI